MKSLFLTASFLFSFSLLALAPVNKTFWGGVAIEGYDPVSYFKEKKAVQGKEDFELKHKDAKWRFSSKENLEAFKKEPSKYEPQFGGYCAWAVSQNSTAGIDPNSFKIVDGKLYLNYNKEIQAKWEKDHKNLIKVAEKNWPGLLK